MRLTSLPTLWPMSRSAVSESQHFHSDSLVRKVRRRSWRRQLLVPLSLSSLLLLLLQPLNGVSGFSLAEKTNGDCVGRDAVSEWVKLGNGMMCSRFPFVCSFGMTSKSPCIHSL